MGLCDMLVCVIRHGLRRNNTLCLLRLLISNGWGKVFCKDVKLLII